MAAIACTGMLSIAGIAGADALPVLSPDRPVANVRWDRAAVPAAEPLLALDLTALVADAPMTGAGVLPAGDRQSPEALAGPWRFAPPYGGGDVTPDAGGAVAGVLGAAPPGRPHVGLKRAGDPPSVLTEVPIVPLPSAIGLAGAGLALLAARRAFRR